MTLVGTDNGALDYVAFKSPINTIMSGAAYTLLVQTSEIASRFYGPIVGSVGANILRQNAADTDKLRIDDANFSDFFTCTLGAGSVFAALKAGYAYDATGTSFVANNGVVATSAVVPRTTEGVAYGFIVGSDTLTAVVRRLTLWNTKLAGATLKALTV